MVFEGRRRERGKGSNRNQDGAVAAMVWTNMGSMVCQLGAEVPRGRLILLTATFTSGGQVSQVQTLYGEENCIIKMRAFTGVQNE